MANNVVSDYMQTEKGKRENENELEYSSTHKVLNYKEILNYFGDDIQQYVGNKMMGGTYSEEFAPSYYFFKALDDNKCLTFRIGNHIPTMQTYYTHNENAPTDKVEGNLSIMFFGANDLNKRQKYIFRPDNRFSTIKINENDVDRFKEFTLHHVHYRTGYMTKRRVEMIRNAVIEWGKNNGSEPYANPFFEDTHITPCEQSYLIKVLLKNQRIEERWQMISEPGGEPIRLNPVEIVDVEGNIMNTGYVYAYLIYQAGNSSDDDEIENFVIDEPEDKEDKNDEIKDFYI